MTMRLDAFQNMFDSRHNMTPKDVNVRAAEFVGTMAELGRFEKEFTVYGSAYYQDCERKYIVSSKEEKIGDFIEQEKNMEWFPTPIISYGVSALVPSGSEAGITRIVKKTLAQKLSKEYPAEYFEDLKKLWSIPANDLAESYLEAWQEKLEGVFEKDKLQLFEGFLRHAYRKKNVTEKIYLELHQWLTSMQQQMIDDKIVKEKYSRTFYGYRYSKLNGQCGYYINARKDCIYRHRQKQLKENDLVSPMVSKTYWYRQEIAPKIARAYFEEDLQKLLNESYWNAWKVLREIPAAITGTFSLEEKVQDYLNNYGENSKEAFLFLCRSWDIL